MEVAKLIQPSFSTADAEFPDVHQEDGYVVLMYKDWQENTVKVFFADPMAFKWQMAETFYEDEDRDDSCYVIENSKWLESHMEQSMAAETEEYNHYKFNFNGCGQFEILATNFTKQT